MSWRHKEQYISSHGIDLILWKYTKLSIRRVNIYQLGITMLQLQQKSNSLRLGYSRTNIPGLIRVIVISTKAAAPHKRPVIRDCLHVQIQIMKI